MASYEEMREALRAVALRMRFVMLAMGLIPLGYLAILLAVALAVPAESLKEVRGSLPWIPIAATFAVISAAAVTVAPRLLYDLLVRKRAFRASDPPMQQFGSVIIVHLALFLTPADLGLVVFFVAGFLWSIPFHLLSLVYVWRFNLGIERFLDRAARDIAAASGKQ